jgi:hypothetical protein
MVWGDGRSLLPLTCLLALTCWCVCGCGRVVWCAVRRAALASPQLEKLLGHPVTAVAKYDGKLGADTATFTFAMSGSMHPKAQLSVHAYRDSRLAPNKAAPKNVQLWRICLFVLGLGCVEPELSCRLCR